MCLLAADLVSNLLKVKPVFLQCFKKHLILRLGPLPRLQISLVFRITIIKHLFSPLLLAFTPQAGRAFSWYCFSFSTSFAHWFSQLNRFLSFLSLFNMKFVISFAFSLQRFGCRLDWQVSLRWDLKLAQACNRVLKSLNDTLHYILILAALYKRDCSAIVLLYFLLNDLHLH